MPWRSPRECTAAVVFSAAGMFRPMVLGGLLAAASACGGAAAGERPWMPPAQRDGHEDPSQLRPAYGNAALHTWWPLTVPEVAAISGLDQAKQGDAHALLALAIVASADRRDAASFERYRQRVDQFLADVKPTVDGAADDWHRGYELHRAMHRVFFAGERGDLGSYRLDQSRVTGIFDEGHYNCISSAMLFTVLARGFGMPVRGVLVPTHAFVEMGPPGGKILEVETTSNTGFDWVHDERFYRETAAQWSSSRGLRPVTLEDYQHRSVVEPYRLMAHGMLNQTVYLRDEGERARMAELAGLVDPDDGETQLMRMRAYVQEAQKLWERKAARTIVKMFDFIGPAVTDISSRRAGDAKVTEMVAWAGWFYADALEVVGRGDEAINMTDSLLDHFDEGWKDAATLRQNLMNVYDDRLIELTNQKSYEAALKAVAKHFDQCLRDKICGHNAGVVYESWAVGYYNLGDWQSERRVLQECVARVPSEAFCNDQLKQLESQHRF